ncbi:U-box domain-containing protein 35 isoform X2 [Senna tora]|uniref:U-box domain-containing protein 35 isoform X2 n=1 Tax=Senna tora TaxID=362788 RepID=A0A834TQD3_9FABA|nr:U-box domain-containing protein 35 isoform X2 [Senna tora]
MEALARLHHRHHPLGSSIDYYCPSLIRRSISSHFLSPPPPSPLSSSIRASSSPPSSSEPPRPNLPIPQTPSSQFTDPFSKISAFATITAASSALFFLGFCRNTLMEKPITLSPMPTVQESKVEEREIEGFLKPFLVHSTRFLKLEEKIPIAHDFKKLRPDAQAWKVLKSQVFSCSEELELVKIGFEEILEKDPYCNKSYHDRILEYLEMVDECKVLLKDIKVAMDRCERENGDLKYYLRFFNSLVERIRVLEGDMLGALKYYQDLEQE